MKCNLEFFVQEKMGFANIDTAGANQMIWVAAFISYKTHKIAYWTTIFILVIGYALINLLILFLRHYTNIIIPSSNDQLDKVILLATPRKKSFNRIGLSNVYASHPIFNPRITLLQTIHLCIYMKKLMDTGRRRIKRMW